MTTVATAWLVYSVALLFEVVLLSVKTSLHVRRPLALVCLVGLCASHAALVAAEPLLFGVPFLFVGMYRIINVMRFAYGRMHTTYLYSVTARSSMQLGILQAAIGVMAWYSGTVPDVLTWSAYIICIGSIVLIGAALVSLISSLKKSRLAPLTAYASTEELPSVTVAIPARNETQDLAECLQSFVASDYKKLEILVLDDCSYDKTADIIKDFAHAGVRFIQGSEPGDTWLAKNAAYQKLASEANGDYIFFCGVDVRVTKNTLQQLMTRVVQQNLRMVSILPSRDSSVSTISDAQMIRYIWELCMPRTLLKRPPVLSTAWLVHTQSLQKVGNFKAVKRKVIPEAYFAKEFFKQKKYSFWRTNNECVVQSKKTIAEQRSTLLRVRYPQLHKRPEALVAVTILELIVILSPVVALNVLPTSLLTWYVVVYLVLYLAVAVVLGWAVSLHKRLYYAFQVVVALPLDVAFSHNSMYKYEFSKVEWKDRNVCMPVMHVIPSLPKLPD